MVQALAASAAAASAERFCRSRARLREAAARRAVAPSRRTSSRRRDGGGSGPALNMWAGSRRSKEPVGVVACARWMRSTGRRAGRRKRRCGDGACAMVCGRGSVCGRGVRVDGEALASPSTTEPGGWLRRGGVGVAASDNPPTTAPSGGSPSSPASSRAPVRPPRTPPHPSHTCARSYLNPPFLLLTCAHHLAPCLCACACAQFAPFSGTIRALTNSGDAGSASDGAVRDDRLFAAHGACYARPLRTHPACRAFCCPPHLPACIHSQHVLI